MSQTLLDVRIKRGKRTLSIDASFYGGTNHTVVANQCQKTAWQSIRAMATLRSFLSARAGN